MKEIPQIKVLDFKLLDNLTTYNHFHLVRLLFNNFNYMFNSDKLEYYMNNCFFDSIDYKLILNDLGWNKILK